MLKMKTKKALLSLVVLSMSLSCGDDDKKDKNHHGPHHGGQYGSGYWSAGGPNWNNYQTGGNQWWVQQQYPQGSSFMPSTTSEKIDELKEKLGSMDNFDTFDDTGDYEYQEFEQVPTWKKFFGTKCYQKVKGESGITGTKFSDNVEAHDYLKQLADSAQSASSSFGSLYYVQKDQFVYGIDFSRPVGANPICRADLSNCSGYSLIITGTNSFPCFP